MKTYKIALAGNPNSGKTTIFNELTGARQHVGNWPGVTVEKKEGYLTVNGMNFLITDLPGTYSLSPYSLDEKIATDFLLKENLDTVVVIIDASNLQRNLFLAMQLLELGHRIVLVLNMMDIAKNKGLDIDIDKLKQILNIDIVPTIANKKIGIADLKSAIHRTVTQRKSIDFQLDYNELEDYISRLTELIKEKTKYDHKKSRWLAIKFLESDDFYTNEFKYTIIDLISEIKSKIGYSPDIYIIERLYAYIHGLYKECVTQHLNEQNRIDLSDKIDRVVTNRFLGIPLFFIIMWLTFQLVFKIGAPIADAIDSLFAMLGTFSATVLTQINAPTWLTSLVTEGIIGGVGSVIVFLPNIMILFFVIAILEDSGYMARAAFVMDKIMHSLGLHGKSFIPMIIGFGCNVPAIMATRTLENEKDRILTILSIPFMSCSARLPIYILFAGTFFPQHQGWIVFFLYITGIVVAVISARLFKSLFFKHTPAPLIMELPPYRVPTLKSALIHMWERSKIFLKKAGTIIFFVVILIWVMASLPFGVEYASQDSLIGKIGAFFAPLLKPAGFGFWQAAVALMFGILAKEVVIGTFGTLYSIGEDSLGAIVAQHFTSLSAISFMLMSLLYIPCVATIAVIKRELNWRWALFATLYTLFIGWIFAVLFFQLANLL